MMMMMDGTDLGVVELLIELSHVWDHTAVHKVSLDNAEHTSTLKTLQR
jgi:hypothetical protein